MPCRVIVLSYQTNITQLERRQSKSSIYKYEEYQSRHSGSKFCSCQCDAIDISSGSKLVFSLYSWIMQLKNNEKKFFSSRLSSKASYSLFLRVFFVSCLCLTECEYDLYTSIGPLLGPTVVSIAKFDSS